MKAVKNSIGLKKLLKRVFFEKMEYVLTFWIWGTQIVSMVHRFIAQMIEIIKTMKFYQGLN